jgi:outer membrane protein assembly factor BamB
MSARLLLGTLCLCAGSALVRAADWPQWLGPRRNGISSETDWSWHWPNEGPRQCWRVSVGAGFSGVSVRDNRLYTLGNAGRGLEKETVWCLDADAGKPVWQYTYPGRNAIVPFPGPRSTPTVEDNAVYTLGQQGQLHCFEKDKGALLWSKDFHAEFGWPSSPKGDERNPKGYGYACSPLVVDELLVLDVGTPNASIVAFDKRTGAVVWKSLAGLGRHPNGSYSSPVSVRWKGKDAVALFASAGVVVLDAKTGDTLWEYGREIEALTGHHVATPVVEGEKLFVSDLGQGGCELLEIGKATAVWKNRCLKNHWSTSVLWNGCLFGFDGRDGSKDAGLVCLDFRTGEEKWRQPTDMSGSLVCAGGKLICLSLKGRLTVVDATPDGYKELASATVFQVDPRKLKEFAPGSIEQGNVISPDVCRTPPVLSGGRLYCRNASGDLVCFDLVRRY